MKEFIVKGSVIEVVLENDKVVKVGRVYIDRCVEKLGIDREEAILTWLEDEGYMDNPDQLELCDQAKENKSNKIVKAKVEKAPKKTHKERTKKENPTKEMIIAEIAKILPNFATNVNIENVGKIITFTVGNDNFKIDLTQKRKPKEEK